jgi:hypothetical protein
VDTSNQFAIITGEPQRFALSELSPETLVALIEWAASRAADENRVLPESKTLANWVNGQNSHGTRYYTHEELLSIDAGLSTTTSLVRLARIGGIYVNPDPDQGRLLPLEEEDCLMLARPQQLVRWVAGYRVHDSDYLQATYSAFAPLSRDALREIVEDQPYTACEAIGTILRVLDMSRTRQKLALDQTASRVMELNAALLRIIR